MFEPANGAPVPRQGVGLPGTAYSRLRPEQVRDVTSQPPEFDSEAILAAAVQRLVRLGKPEAAAALAASSITSFRSCGGWSSVEVFIASPDDAYDVLTQDDLYTHDVDLNNFGEQYTVWGTSRLATVFTQVLPARVTCRDVEVKIMAGPVDPNWRDEFRRFLTQPSGSASSAAALASGERPRQPGRPAWTRDLFWSRYRDALGRTAPPHTNASIAAHLEMLDGELGTEPDYLRKLVKRFGLPPA